MEKMFLERKISRFNYFVLIAILYLSSKINDLKIFYQNGLKVVTNYLNDEFHLNPPNIQKLLVAPLKIFFDDFPYILSFNLNRIDINPSKLELDSELIELLNAKNGRVKEINNINSRDWEEINFQNDITLDILEYKTKGLLIKELKYLLTKPFNEKEIIEDSIDTNYPESTNYIKRQLYAKGNLNKYDVNNLRHFCDIVNEVVYLMHLNDDQNYYLQKTAEKYWDNHKENRKTNMETDWFQPELYKIFISKFKPENVSKEPELTRGKVDFLIFNIPIDAKCYNDKKNKNKKEKSGIELLENEINQVYQYSSHTNLGIMIGYDFRDKESTKDIKVQSITERIEFKTKGHKLIGKFILIRRKTPTDIK